jgi:hypothetical protein
MATEDALLEVDVPKESRINPFVPKFESSVPFTLYLAIAIDEVLSELL